ncbi:DUF6966 domain-containing protein [Azonexus sp. IMCC34842]|uniref:DUF6966 domain-containing protein n=1 Tax=Azonexus sp. IMCC34842 TaxID=3420950 RepID=UPI003D146346
MNRSGQLNALIASLSELVEFLSLDQNCQWRRHFEYCLSRANDLKVLGFEQSQLNELSGSIRSVFGGMGSFNDYAPLAANPNGSFSVVPGMEHLERFSGKVYESALALMVVEGGVRAL